MPLSAFYATAGGRPSGYCKKCQRRISRRSRQRRLAAVRLLIALHPQEWTAALRCVEGSDTCPEWKTGERHG
jgi:hypothetical protein